MPERSSEIGGPIGVGEKDIKRIRRRSLWDRIRYPILGITIVTLSAVAGFLLGDKVLSSQYGWSSYPFIPLATATMSPRSRRTFIIITVIGSVLLFGIAMILGMRNEPTYGAGVEYGSYYQVKHGTGTLIP